MITQLMNSLMEMVIACTRIVHSIKERFWNVGVMWLVINKWDMHAAWNQRNAQVEN